jgi:hypothetical protein
VTWNAGTLAPGIGGTLTLTVQGTAPGVMLNSATATSDTIDPNPYDDTASVSVTVGTVMSPMLSALAVNSGHTFQFAVSSTAGQTNVVQVSTNLANPYGWTPIYTNTGSFLFIDSQSTNYSMRFYRDVTLP